MPNAAETRNMIRSTWLNKKHWGELGFEVKTLFLVASQNDDLGEEIKKYDDILLLDFKENHYGLPAKDFHFLEFIENKCRFVEKFKPFNRYNRGLETCPQEKTSKRGRAILFSFFSTCPSDEYDSAPSRKYSHPLLDVFA